MHFGPAFPRWALGVDAGHLFFYGALRLTGAVAPKYPGAELNGNKSWTGIEGLDTPGERVVWPLWLSKGATLKLAVTMEVPADAAGALLDTCIGSLDPISQNA